MHWRDNKRLKRRVYLVKWKGYPLHESSWEPEENLENARKLLDAFKRANGL